MTSSGNELPQRMIQNGRPLEPIFDPEEELFRRCKQGELTEDQARLEPMVISYDKWSVNRGKYSEPSDVLLPNWLEWGIAMFKVKHLPRSLQSTSGTNVFDFEVRHEPEMTNYAHSEVVTMKNGTIAIKPDPPKEVKKQFRKIVSDYSVILKIPQV